MKITIERATIKNLKDIQFLNKLLFIKEEKEYDSALNTKWPIENEGEDYFKKQITDPERVVFVAKDEDKIIGYIAGSTRHDATHKNNALVARLENFYVLEDHRNNGIGSRLVEKLIDWAKNLGVKRIVVTASHNNDRAIKFYKNQGFADFDVKLKLDL